ncbi:MAG: LamG domain-containing protein [Sedimentisphaerales bacterium]|nr:LamG domain-containing protein [Sedimentisphaerales bacterium]
MMKKVLTLVLCLSVGSMVSADLVHHWALDGDATDSGSVPVNGVEVGGVTYAASPLGGAAVFNGTSTGIQLASQLLPASQTITLAYWVNLDTYNAGSWYDSVISTDGWDYTAGSQSIHSVIRPDYEPYGWVGGQIVVGLGIGGAENWTTNGNVDLNTWAHFAWTFDSTGADLVCNYYINGQLDATHTLTGLGGTAIPYSAATIGAWNSDGLGSYVRFLDGMVDDVRIYDEVLDETAINNLPGVPEPMTLSLLALGGLALARHRR